MTRLFDEAFLRRLEHLAIVFRRAANSQMQGERRSAQRGQSVEFSDFRPYSLGDDFRRIDWNAYARLERLFIKLFVEEQDTTLHILLDASPSMGWGQPEKLATAARLAGALGYIALAGLDRVAVSALGVSGAPHGLKRLPALRGKRAALEMFNFLSQISVNSVDQDLAEKKTALSPTAALTAYANNAGGPGPLLLLSDLMDDGWQPGLNRLGGRGFEVSLLHVLAPDELAPDLNGDFKLIDSETSAEIEISADFETLERYRQYLAGWQAAWHTFCAARNMHYLALNTAMPLEDLLFASLPQQGVVR